jgi:hypothetical protein
MTGRRCPAGSTDGSSGPGSEVTILQGGSLYRIYRLPRGPRAGHATNRNPSIFTSKTCSNAGRSVAVWDWVDLPSRRPRTPLRPVNYAPPSIAEDGLPPESKSTVSVSGSIGRTPVDIASQAEVRSWSLRPSSRIPKFDSLCLATAP